MVRTSINEEQDSANYSNLGKISLNHPLFALSIPYLCSCACLLLLLHTYIVVDLFVGLFMQLHQCSLIPTNLKIEIEICVRSIHPIQTLDINPLKFLKIYSTSNCGYFKILYTSVPLIFHSSHLTYLSLCFSLNCTNISSPHLALQEAALLQHQHVYVPPLDVISSSSRSTPRRCGFFFFQGFVGVQFCLNPEQKSLMHVVRSYKNTT